MDNEELKELKEKINQIQNMPLEEAFAVAEKTITEVIHKLNEIIREGEKSK